MLAGILTDFKDALMSGMAGLSRPTQLQAGGMWIDTTFQTPPTYYWAFKLWTGTVDVEIFRINMNSNYGGALTSEALFEVSQISADTQGAILEIIKNRFVDNGQVDSGDTVAEVQMIGRTNTSTNPTVGYIKWVATDDMGAAASGGTLSFFSTPDASSTISEHLKAVGGLLETPLPYKLNSQRLVIQNVATAATIVQLSASKVGVEFTGVTATSVQGINSGHDSQVIMLHNRSTATITLLNENLTAAAVDRMKLPLGDFTIAPQATATLFYCTADSRWKMKDTLSSGVTRTKTTISGLINTWTAPTDVFSITVYGKSLLNRPSQDYLLDRFGVLYAWGSGFLGSLGIGDFPGTPRSSPVLVSGGLNFRRTMDRGPLNNSMGFAITLDGKAYGWGANNEGQLGVGDQEPKSLPTLVLGGLVFSTLTGAASNGRNVFGITPSGKAYAWGGGNTFGTSWQLGTGTNSNFSSPVAVLGGLKWEKIISNGSTTFGLTSTGSAYAWGSVFLGIGGANTTESSPVAVIGGLTFKKIEIMGSAFFGITPAGALYAWGSNDDGQLGVGDTVERSSPVAVLGGLVFSDLQSTENSHVLAITTDGVAYAWGRNGSGQLGVGDVVPRSSPVAVLGGLVFTKIYVQTIRSFGITSDGTAYSWGGNNEGQLGIGSTISKSSPTAVVGGIKFTDFFQSNNYTHGLAIDGLLYGWGTNDNGELGVGDAVYRSSPTVVIGPQGFNNALNGQETQITVVPGVTYNIYLTQHGACYFGDTVIGNRIEEIEIDYEKRGI